MTGAVDKIPVSSHKVSDSKPGSVRFEHLCDLHYTKAGSDFHHYEVSKASTSLYLEFIFKDPFKRIKHVGKTLSNIIRCNMYDPFEQHNQTCWIVLDGVG